MKFTLFIAIVSSVLGVMAYVAFLSGDHFGVGFFIFFSILLGVTSVMSYVKEEFQQLRKESGIKQDTTMTTS